MSLGCKIRREIWKRIRLIAKKVSKFEISESPAFLLIHHNRIFSIKYKKSILPLILDAAKINIAKEWRGDRAPEMEGLVKHNF